jgi:hypothetical protein
VDEVAPAVAEGSDHLVGGAGIDGRDRFEIEPALEAGVLEHGHRLAAMIDQHLAALQLVPRKAGIRAAAG